MKQKTSACEIRKYSRNILHSLLVCAISSFSYFFLVDDIRKGAAGVQPAGPHRQHLLLTVRGRSSVSTNILDHARASHCKPEPSQARHGLFGQGRAVDRPGRAGPRKTGFGLTLNYCRKKMDCIPTSFFSSKVKRRWLFLL